MAATPCRARRANQLLRFRESGKPVEIPGPWQVSFPPNFGAPAEVTLPELISLHQHSDPGVKYFSGTATYTQADQALARPRRATGGFTSTWAGYT